MDRLELPFRVAVEGTGRRVPDAATTFRLPAGSIVWSHGLQDHYEALYERRNVEDMREGDWAAPPITVKLPGNAGYAAITEADHRADDPGAVEMETRDVHRNQAVTIAMRAGGGFVLRLLNPEP